MNGAISKAERKTKSEKTVGRMIMLEKNKLVRCFTCGKRGHWADSCPDSKQSKISTFCHP
jgi:hypothetical protein